MADSYLSQMPALGRIPTRRLPAKSGHSHNAPLRQLRLPLEPSCGAVQGPSPVQRFEKAMEVILAEHDRRAALAPPPKRRKTDH
jgi:hypothetical protein